MSRVTETKVVRPAGPLHAIGLGTAALGLLLGLVTRQPAWASAAISLVILLPPLRLATTIIAEARAGRYGVAAMGILVLALLLFSRRIS
jgi:hypothetical protein